MFLKQIKLSAKAKDSLVRLKTRTGLTNWNVLCRWALCYSLHEDTVPINLPVKEYSNVEMSWQTFAGEYSEIYEALIKQWCMNHKLGTDDQTLALYFRLHLERGISHLAGTGLIKSIDDLVGKALDCNDLS